MFQIVCMLHPSVIFKIATYKNIFMFPWFLVPWVKWSTIQCMFDVTAVVVILPQMSFKSSLFCPWNDQDSPYFSKYDQRKVTTYQSATTTVAISPTPVESKTHSATQTFMPLLFCLFELFSEQINEFVYCLVPLHMMNSNLSINFVIKLFTWSSE